MVENPKGEIIHNTQEELKEPVLLFHRLVAGINIDYIPVWWFLRFYCDHV